MTRTSTILALTLLLASVTAGCEADNGSPGPTIVISAGPGAPDIGPDDENDGSTEGSWDDVAGEDATAIPPARCG